jgi:hypothetical protein
MARDWPARRDAWSRGHDNANPCPLAESLSIAVGVWIVGRPRLMTERIERRKSRIET